MGVGFFANDSRLRYGHFVWHLFVVSERVPFLRSDVVRGGAGRGVTTAYRRFSSV